MTHPILSKLFAFGVAAVLGGALLSGSATASADAKGTAVTVATDPPGAARRELRAEIHQAHRAVVEDRVEPGQGEPRGLWGLERWDMHTVHMDGQEAMRELQAR